MKRTLFVFRKTDNVPTDHETTSILGEQKTTLLQ